MSQSPSPGGSSTWRSTANQREISDLICKLQALLPHTHTQPRHPSKVSSTSGVMKEVCKYIRKLHEEVDDLSQKLCQLLAAADLNNNAIDPHTLSTLLQHLH